MIERLSFTPDTPYSATESAIHLNRYAMARPFCKDAVVLDAACGEGYGSYLMKTWGALHVEGVDINEEAISNARSRFRENGLQYTQHDVLHLPYENNSFDLVVSFETMEHVDDAEQLLLELKRVLKPTGTLLLSCPNDHYYYEQNHLENPFHKRRYTFFEFKELAESILGGQAEYFLSFALDGFVNIPFEERTEPEQRKKATADELLRYTKCDDAYQIMPDRFLNQWNSNYYLGIWSGQKELSLRSVVFFPRDFFMAHRDEDYDLRRHLLNAERALEKQYKQKTANAFIERDRLKTLLDFAQKENALQKAAWDATQAELAKYQRTLAEINASRGMKLLRLYSRFRAWLSRIFRRNRA